MRKKKEWFENLKFPHIQMPKALLEGEQYRGLSPGAKILYALMLDRMRLSRKNEWYDDDGNVFIYFTLDDIMMRLHISRGTATKYKKELLEAGLIRFVAKGKADPHRMYVLPFLNANVKSDKETSCSSETGLREVQFLDSNNTKENNVGDSDINLSGEDGYSHDVVKEIIRKNVEYDVLSEREYNMDIIDGYIDIMTNAVCSSQPYINIGADRVPVGMVRSRFLKYSMSNILYVYSCMEDTTSEIRNIHAYLLKALYDAPSTMASYYKAKVQHDMPQYAGIYGKGGEAYG